MTSCAQGTPGTHNRSSSPQPACCTWLSGSSQRSPTCQTIVFRAVQNKSSQGKARQGRSGKLFICHSGSTRLVATAAATGGVSNITSSLSLSLSLSLGLKGPKSHKTLRPSLSSSPCPCPPPSPSPAPSIVGTCSNKPPALNSHGQSSVNPTRPASWIPTARFFFFSGHPVSLSDCQTVRLSDKSQIDPSPPICTKSARFRPHMPQIRGQRPEGLHT